MPVVAHCASPIFIERGYQAGLQRTERTFGARQGVGVGRIPEIQEAHQSVSGRSSQARREIEPVFQHGSLIHIQRLQHAMDELSLEGQPVTANGCWLGRVVGQPRASARFNRPADCLSSNFLERREFIRAHGVATVV